jgi:hypothetical protein
LLGTGYTEKNQWQQEANEASTLHRTPPYIPSSFMTQGEPHQDKAAALRVFLFN